MLFDEFAYGHEEQYDQRWMDYFWVKEFMKVHCIVPSPEIPDVMIDELYTTFCNPQERKSRKHRIKQDPIVWEKKFAEGKEPEPFTEFGDDWKADAKYRFVNFLTEIAKRKFQLSDPQSALNDLIRIYLFPLSLWNLKITKLKYVWTWDMVLYLLKWKFRDNPDFAHYFDPIILTQSSVEDYDDIREVPQVQAEEVEESSEEDSVYEYDVLLYLKEDIARRNKGFTKVHINPCRKCLKAIVLTCQKVFGLVYGILTVLPKYMCAKKKPDEKDKAFKAPRKVGKKEVMKYLKEEKGGKKYDHKQSPPWAVVVNILINSMIEADNDWAGRIREKTCPIFIMSCTNAIALVFKLLEYYTLASFAFKPESIWFHSQGAEVALNFNNGKMPFVISFPYQFTNFRMITSIGASGSQS